MFYNILLKICFTIYIINIILLVNSIVYAGRYRSPMYINIFMEHEVDAQ